MTSITVLPETEYQTQIEKAEAGEINASPEYCRKTNITPEDMIGNIVSFSSPRTHHSWTLGEVTAIDMNAENCPKATISELFTNREFTETGRYTGSNKDSGFINLTLPLLGDEHTVKWLEAKINGEWEPVSNIHLERAINDFTHLKHEYDTTRVVKKTYTHNPQGLCTYSIKPADDQTRGDVIPDRSQFTDPDLYDRLMNNVVVPDSAGKRSKLGTLYTQSDKRQHDETRKHKIVGIQVDRLAQPDNSPVGTAAPFNIGLSLPEKIKYVLGPNTRENVFGVDPRKENNGKSNADYKA